MKYICSDLHFFHKNIIKYCNRPYEFSWNGVKQMNEDILKVFDELPSGSEILNLGDICLNYGVKFDELKTIVDRMKSNNKKLSIVLGNHDREITKIIKKTPYDNSVDFFKALGFDEVYVDPIKIDNFVLSHEPVYELKDGEINIHGHTHDVSLYQD